MSPEQLESARRECVIQSAMLHPNIVKLYEYTETDEEIRIFMEYMNLSDYLEEKVHDVSASPHAHRQRLRPVKNQAKLTRYAREIVEALAHIHASGVVHCDLKLSNIFACKDTESANPEIHLKLSDFGLALPLDPTTHKAFMPLKAGTFNYLAPEVGNVFLPKHKHRVGRVHRHCGGHMESGSDAVRDVRRLPAHRLGRL